MKMKMIIKFGDDDCENCGGVVNGCFADNGAIVSSPALPQFPLNEVFNKSVLSSRPLLGKVSKKFLRNPTVIKGEEGRGAVFTTNIP